MLGRITRSLLLLAVSCGLLTLSSPAQQTSETPKNGAAPSQSAPNKAPTQPSQAPEQPAQQSAKVTLETSETLFTLAAALNNCGYNEDLSVSDPVRAQVRQDIAQALSASQEAQAVSGEMCNFYRDHQQGNTGRSIAQYISLALNLTEPPQIALKLKEADLPPDANYVLGFVPLVQRFYETASVHRIWLKHKYQYDAIIDRQQAPVSNLLLSTDVYLRLAISGYLGRHFSIYIEPQLGPNEVNARNFGLDYYLVASPQNGKLNLEQVRHTYLHFTLDPMLLKRYQAMKKLEPLLKSVASAPLDDYYKKDIVLLTTECVIRAVEARTLPGGRAAEPKRQEAVDKAVAEGFILTRYFYEQLVTFESEPAGLQDSIGDWFYNLDVGKERKRAEQVQFAAKASPDIVSTQKPKASLLDLAEQRMSVGDYNGAAKLAQQALDEKTDDQGRALFLLAQAATLNRDLQGARSYYEKTIQVANNPRLVAWSHIYLGRISDMQAEREDALQHYRAALAAGAIPPEAKAAAERGLQQPYEPRAHQ